MGKVIECLTEREEEFIRKQKVFFVATAPLSEEHHVNVSPKAPGTSVIVLDPYTVAYCDLSGSGAETSAHVLQNQRMTLLFCNIESGPPKILRLYGQARLLAKDCIADKIEFDKLVPKFPTSVTQSYGFRAMFILKIDRMSSSCGYTLPVLHFEKYRQTLEEFTQKKGKEGMIDYRVLKNSFSIDGLPSLSIYSYKGQKDKKQIVPKPENGYIFGELAENGETNGVANGHDAASNGYVIPKQKKNSSTWQGSVVPFLFGLTLGVSFMFVMNNSSLCGGNGGRITSEL